jgi:diguanylate cyclase (GGDEF)-like protein
MPCNHLIGPIVAAIIGVLSGRLTAVTTIRRLHRKNTALVQEARHDRLTGVLNRAGLEDAYTAINNRDKAVIVVDLDMFKSVNDEHGHPVGDRVLSMLGARIHDLAARHGGWAGRLGGDEFALIVPDCPRREAEAAAAAAAAVITITDRRTGAVRVEGSAGVAFTSSGTAWAEALADADIALYHAKKGRGVVVFAHGMTYPRRPSSRRQARDARSDR